MTEQAISPVRRRMIEDMAIRKLGAKTQHDYVQRVKDFAVFLGRSPDKAGKAFVAISFTSRRAERTRPRSTLQSRRSGSSSMSRSIAPTSVGRSRSFTSRARCRSY